MADELGAHARTFPRVRGVSLTQGIAQLQIALCNDHGHLFRITPIGPRETEVEVTCLVRGDAVEGRDYDVETVGWLWEKTLAQDLELCERTQLGVESSVYSPGPHSEEEASVDAFLLWYLGLLESGLREAPSGLREEPRI